MSLPKFYDPALSTGQHTNRLPHWSQQERTYFVTFRLEDSVPMAKLRRHVEARRRWAEKQGPRPWTIEVEREYHIRFFGKVERWLDLGSGSCLLRDPENASIAAECLKFFEDQKSRVHGWVVMPNHVHVLFETMGKATPAELIKSWKGYSARRINERMGRSGSLWQRSYFDRMVRDWEHFARCVRYIRRNPEKAKLAKGEFLTGESELAGRF